MTLRTSNQMLLKRLQSTDTYILTCCNSSTVSLTHVLHCTEGEKAAATAGEENWLKAWSLPSSENIFLFGFSFGVFLLKLKECVAEHCGSGRKGAAPSSKLKQVKKSKQDGYAPFLSHPSQALRLLQLSHCAKQFALSCSLLRTFAVPQPPMVQSLSTSILLYSAWRCYWTTNVSFHSNLQSPGPFPSTDLQDLS